ncbi:MAG: hypothetical protein J6Y98_05785 [Bacteroidales bacterium]|nr:hypothetical protein [Bacteroidales bacterium]
MKKIALFAATMMLFVGMAMAQAPAKKTSENQPKATPTQSVKSDNKDAQKKSCGNCPHHQCAGKQADAKQKDAKSENKPSCQKQCGNKEGCNHDGKKEDQKKSSK